MAELTFEAPLASFEGEEWSEFNDFQTSKDDENSNSTMENITKKIGSVEIDNFSEKIAGSLEDLVNSFDEKITECFKNYDEQADKIAPVQIRTQDEIMKENNMWWTITGNYGNIMPIDWSKTYAMQLQAKALKLGEKREIESPDLDLSDDDELTEALDMHRMIVSNLQEQDPIFTADQVIEEIDDIMAEADSADDSPSGAEVLSPLTSQLYEVRGIDITSATTFMDSLKLQPVRELNKLIEDMEMTIKTYSETLITELAKRDDLEYDKDLKNEFISLVLSVQKKRREYQIEKKKGIKKLKSGGDGNYLTTIIPYNASMGVPSNEQMQIYIKLLRAVHEDSPNVPGLLTDYILKVLCPTK